MLDVYVNMNHSPSSETVMDMKSLHLQNLALVALLFVLAPACTDSSEDSPCTDGTCRIEDGGLVLDMNPGKLKITPLAERIIRVNYTAEENFSDRESLSVIKQNADDLEWSADREDGALVVKTNSLRVMVNQETGAVTFQSPDGEVILAEPAQGGKEARAATVSGEAVWQVKQQFRFASGEALYGLGQFQEGHMNYRGRRVLLVQENQIAVNPFLVSTAGYGVLWDNYSKTEFDDTQLEEDGTSIGSFWSDVADGIDYYFVYGPELDDVVSGYRTLTGSAPMFPKWAFGYWQSKERYRSFDELIEVVAEYRDRGIPIDNIVQDWRYWGDLGWSPLLFGTNTPPYANPQERISEIHDLDAHFMVSAWPIIGNQSAVAHELDAAGYLFEATTLFPDARLYDPYSAEARSIYWKHMKAGLFDNGVDGWWLDGTEPQYVLTGFFGTWDQAAQEESVKELGSNALGSMARYLNPFSLLATQGVYEGQREVTSDKRVYILTRSSFAGQQRYAATTWSGDINASWPILRAQISAGLNFTMTGIPYWTTDIGGFFAKSDYDGHEDERYRDLYVRWFQFGTFCPIFRSHGTGTPREMWRFGEPGDVTYDTLVKFDQLRYRLLPYIYSLAWMVTDDDYTMMRGLAMDFRADERVYDIDDQFMFGPALLVNPITEPSGAEDPTRDVYLPEGIAWYDFWTGEQHEGGQTLTVSVPLSTMPLYVKAGSILPMGPFVQYAAEKSDPVELRIYPGADAELILYEDENDNYNYEEGAYSTIALRWNDSDRTLVIGARSGEYPGMLETRTFDIVIVGSDKGAGLDPAQEPDETVAYRGQEMTIALE